MPLSRLQERPTPGCNERNVAFKFLSFSNNSHLFFFTQQTVCFAAVSVTGFDFAAGKCGRSDISCTSLCQCSPMLYIQGPILVSECWNAALNMHLLLERSSPFNYFACCLCAETHGCGNQSSVKSQEGLMPFPSNNKPSLLLCLLSHPNRASKQDASNRGLNMFSRHPLSYIKLLYWSPRINKQTIELIHRALVASCAYHATASANW